MPADDTGAPVRDLVERLQQPPLTKREDQTRGDVILDRAEYRELMRQRSEAAAAISVGRTIIADLERRLALAASPPDAQPSADDVLQGRLYALSGDWYVDTGVGEQVHIESWLYEHANKPVRIVVGALAPAPPVREPEHRELYYCGCERVARWTRCADHAGLEHDEEPPPANSVHRDGVWPYRRATALPERPEPSLSVKEAAKEIIAIAPYDENDTSVVESIIARVRPEAPSEKG